MPRSLCMKVKFNLRKVSRSRSSRQNSTQGVQTPTSHCLKMRGFLHGMTFLDLLTVLQISYGVFGVVFGTRMVSAVSLSHHDAASTTPSTHTHTHLSLSLCPSFHSLITSFFPSYLPPPSFSSASSPSSHHLSFPSLSSSPSFPLPLSPPPLSLSTCLIPERHEIFPRPELVIQPTLSSPGDPSWPVHSIGLSM